MEWTKERHEAVKVRCAEATPGPWATYDGGWRNHARAAVNPWRFMHVVVPIDGPPKYPGHVVSEFIAELKDAQDDGARRVEVDAAFIAAARTDLPDALAEIERLTSKLAGIESAAAESDGMMVTISEQAAEIEKAQHDLRIKASLYEMALKDIERLSAISTAGEDLPDALAEIERLTAELAGQAKAATDWRDTAERHRARAEAQRPGLTIEQAERWSRWLNVDVEAGANTWLRDALLAASRGETGPAGASRPGLTEEEARSSRAHAARQAAYHACIGDEPARVDAGWRAFEKALAAPSPGDISVPRAILERLAKAVDPTFSDAREARWAAERILQRAPLAAEPARTDPEAARRLAEAPRFEDGAESLATATTTPGTRVRTADRLVGSAAYRPAHGRLRNALGTVMRRRESPVPRFDVRHDIDGNEAPYDAEELIVIEPNRGGQ